MLTAARLVSSFNRYLPDFSHGQVLAQVANKLPRCRAIPNFEQNIALTTWQLFRAALSG